MNSRQERAQQMMAEPDYAAQTGRGEFRVRSQSNPDKSYMVRETASGLVCECPDHTYRKADCKHIKVVLERIRKNRAGTDDGFRMMARSEFTLCKFCDSGRLKKDGIRKNRKGDAQQYKCLDCKKRFTMNPGFERMRSKDAVITRALQMYYSGMSVRDIADCLEQEDVRVSHMTVYRWVEKYSRMTNGYVKGIVPRVSETWRTDEIFMKVSGEQKYYYSMMDNGTRFMIAKLVAETKGTEDVSPMFREAAMIAGKIPATLISDGAANFHEAWGDHYRARNFLWKGTEHIRHIHMKGDRNNNRMERLNGTVRDREVAYRGIKKATSPLFDGFQTYYNFTKKHGGIGRMTPAEAALIWVDGPNKWKTIIQNAALAKL